MFIAITAITENGQPLYCINPVETTGDMDQAFTWATKAEADQVLREAKAAYNLDAVAVEIVKAKFTAGLKSNTLLSFA